MKYLLGILGILLFASGLGNMHFFNRNKALEDLLNVAEARQDTTELRVAELEDSLLFGTLQHRELTDSLESIIASSTREISDLQHENSDIMRRLAERFSDDPEATILLDSIVLVTEQQLEACRSVINSERLLKLSCEEQLETANSLIAAHSEDKEALEDVNRILRAQLEDQKGTFFGGIFSDPWKYAAGAVGCVLVRDALFN